MTASLVKTLIFTLVVPGMVGVYLPYSLRGPGPHPVALLCWIAPLPAAAGLAVYLWCAWDFATFGRGTPLPLDPPRQLVARGLYRFVRNPMYVGVLLFICAQAIWFASWRIAGYAVFVALMFHLFVVFYEEPTLRNSFGESYPEYCKTVSRWLPKRAA